MKPKISIIVPVYKAEKYLNRCISSILNQTMSDFELIIVNDGSPDNSLTIAESYAKEDDRVIVLSDINRGVSAARNAGLKIASGKYIGFVDADDWIYPEMYEQLSFYLEKYNADSAVCGYYRESVKRVPYRVTNKCKVLSEAEIHQQVLPGFVHGLPNVVKSSVCNKLYSAELLKKSGALFPIDLKLAEDLEFNRKVLPQAKRIVLLPHLLYNYNALNKRATRSAIKDYHMVYLEKRARSIQYLRENNLDSDDMLIRVHALVAEDVLSDFGYCCSPQCNKNPLKGFESIVRLRDIPELVESISYAKSKYKFSRVRRFILNCFLRRRFLPIFLYGLTFGWLIMPLKMTVKSAFTLLKLGKEKLTGKHTSKVNI